AMLTKNPFENDEYWHSHDAGIEGPNISLITDGKSGGKVFTQKNSVFYTALSTPTIEETGAGDAFGSGFIAALMKGHDIQTGLEWAKKQAASVVSYMGAKK